MEENFQPSKGPKRILVAEDIDSNYILVMSILKKYYQVVWAKNGAEAVERMEKESFDAILMDIKMPVLDGLEATRTIRANGSDIPIIALTANAFEKDRTMAIEAGCNDFIAKPLNRIQLLEMLAKYI